MGLIFPESTCLSVLVEGWFHRKKRHILFYPLQNSRVERIPLLIESLQHHVDIQTWPAHLPSFQAQGISQASPSIHPIASLARKRPS